MAAARPLPGSVVRLLRLTGFPIVQQLQLEEALMRATPHNWFLINDGTPTPAVVLGVSGKPQELVHLSVAAHQHVPLIKRFTGGGTVVVDHDTIFTALIMQQQCLPEVAAYPRPVMQYTEHLYSTAFAQHGAFHLRENDYCFGERKFGGNAQAITKNRWVHHTSFLWDYQNRHMALLKQPARQPDYRQGRNHLEFVLRLQEVLPCRARLLDQLCASVETAGFTLHESSLAEAEEALAKTPLCGTRLLDVQQLLADEQQRLEQQAVAATAAADGG